MTLPREVHLRQSGNDPAPGSAPKATRKPEPPVLSENLDRLRLSLALDGLRNVCKKVEPAAFLNLVYCS